jgi:iron complex outermembrane receptor protein
MFRRSKLSTALVLAFGGVALCSPALAQQTGTQRIEITGSNIKRIDAETVAPIEIITRDQIERTGQPTAADVLRNLPMNTGSFGESFSNSFAPGAAGISLRGLGQKTTLVLINGRRVAGYGFAQNLQDTFVDLNSIPSSAVDRVEILKDGASAIYGSDAIAGVVNIILRKDYRGLEASISGGAFEGKNDLRGTLAFGMGDIDKDKFNLFAALDVYHRDLLLQGDTKFLASRDMRKYAGGRNFQSLTGGGTWAPMTTPTGTTTVSNTRQAITDCAGTVMTGPEAVEAGLINPVGAANLAQAAATNTFCTYDFKNQFTALPGTDRVGALIRGNMQVAPNVNAYTEIGLSRTETEQTFQAPFFAGTTGLLSTPAGLRPFPYNITFGPGVAGNPFAGNARYIGVLQDMGTRDNEITSTDMRGLVGLSYTLGNWDLDSALGFSRNKVETINTNRITLAGTSAAFGVGTGVQPPVPVSSGSTYNLDQWTLNSDAVRDSIRADFPRKSTSELSFIDTRASTTFGQMPGGPMGLAVGVEYRKESLKDVPDPVASSGGILGQGITATNGSRNNTSVFAEFAFPFTKALEAQLAVRHDRYSDYGSSTTPKVGFKFRPNDMMLFRANWGKGFRAPTLPEISPSVATFFTSVIDPEDDVARNISGVFAGNPDLRAEKSTSRNFGLVFEPMKDLSFGLSYYHIDWRNVVASPSFQDIIDESCPAGPPCPSTASVVRDPTTNFVVTVLSNYENLAQRVTSGLDADFKVGMPTRLGKVTVRGDAVYVRSFKEDGVEYVGSNGGSNTIPRIRAGLTVDLDTGPWSVTGRVNYTHKVTQELLAGSFFTAQDPRFQNGVFPNTVASHTTVDVFARYNINKNLQVSGAILNAFDKTPPYDPGFSSTSLYDFSLHDIRGRQFRLTLKYTM